MKTRHLKSLFLAVGAASMAATAAAAPKAEPRFDWTTVVNNTDLMPPLEVRNFNSYNQPSVNLDGLVVIRAAAAGATDPRHLHPRYEHGRQPHHQHPR
jgi:hypothetical protein